jgi:hypothetical protein
MSAPGFEPDDLSNFQRGKLFIRVGVTVHAEPIILKYCSRLFSDMFAMTATTKLGIAEGSQLAMCLGYVIVYVFMTFLASAILDVRKESLVASIASLAGRVRMRLRQWAAGPQRIVGQTCNGRQLLAVPMNHVQGYQETQRQNQQHGYPRNSAGRQPRLTEFRSKRCLILVRPDVEIWLNLDRTVEARGSGQHGQAMAPKLDDAAGRQAGSSTSFSVDDDFVGARAPNAQGTARALDVRVNCRDRSADQLQRAFGGASDRDAIDADRCVHGAYPAVRRSLNASEEYFHRATGT